MKDGTPTAHAPVAQRSTMHLVQGTTRQRIAALLADRGEMRPNQIATELGIGIHVAGHALSRMLAAGEVVRLGHGRYVAAGDEPLELPPDRIDTYLAYCVRRGYRPTTIASTRTTLRRLQAQRVECGLGPLEDATEAEMESWWAGLEVTAGSRVGYRAAVIGYFGWLVRERVRDDDPTTRLERPRQRQGLPRPIPDADLRLALDQADPRTRAWLCLACYGGLRAMEIAPLRREDIREDLGLLLVRDGKGGKQRTVPTHPEILRALDGLPTSGYLFPYRRGSGPISAHLVSMLASRYLRGLGLNSSFHALRHWFGSSLYRQTLDLRLVGELMGHSNPATTAQYCAWASDRAAAHVGALTV